MKTRPLISTLAGICLLASAAGAKVAKPIVTNLDLPWLAKKTNQCVIDSAVVGYEQEGCQADKVYVFNGEKKIHCGKGFTSYEVKELPDGVTLMYDAGNEGKPDAIVFTKIKDVGDETKASIDRVVLCQEKDSDGRLKGIPRGIVYLALIDRKNGEFNVYGPKGNKGNELSSKDDSIAIEALDRQYKNVLVQSIPGLTSTTFEKGTLDGDTSIYMMLAAVAVAKDAEITQTVHPWPKPRKHPGPKPVR